MTPQALIDHVRTWLDVPYLHQGRSREGVDCLGLIQMPPRELGLMLDVPIFNDYARTPDGLMLPTCRKYLIEAEMQIGGVVVFDMGAGPQHMAYLGDYRHGGLSLIHALNRNKKVVEHRLDPTWRARVVASFVIPGVGA